MNDQTVRLDKNNEFFFLFLVVFLFYFPLFAVKHAGSKRLE